MKCKKISVYQHKEDKTIFINPTKDKNGRFVIKYPTQNYGSANSNTISDEELGRKVREALEQAD
jgi:hypothetical protein